MKKFNLVAFLMGFVLCSNAAHVVGGEIYYKHLTGTASVRDYEVTLVTYSDANGGVIPPVQINYTSSCNSGGQTTPTLVPNPPMSPYSFYSCAALLGGVAVIQRTYVDTITLPSNCSDWLFYWEDCCKTPLYDNISSPSSSGTYIKARLNDGQGSNSSPFFDIAPLILTYCPKNSTEAPYFKFEKVIETDGDSLVFSLGQPSEGPHPGSPVTWNPNYSKNNPIDSWNGVSIDPRTGTLTFSPKSSGTFLIKLNVDEYRFDPTTVKWEFVGSVEKEFMLVVFGSCSQSSKDWNIQFLDSATSITPLDTAHGNCGDSLVRFYTNTPYLCSSLQADGSDFVLTKPDGTPIGIKEAISSCNGLHSSQIDLLLTDTISVTDTLYLFSKIGRDSNTLINVCGNHLNENDSLTLIIANCSGIGLKENIITGALMELYPNPVKDRLTIKLNSSGIKEDILLNIINAKGEVVKHFETHLNSDDLKDIDLSFLPKGIYLIQATINNQRIFTSKFEKL